MDSCLREDSLWAPSPPFPCGSVSALGFPDMKKSKLTLGRLTIQSIELQVTTILKSIHGGGIVIRKINPLRTDTGNFVSVQFKTPADPQLRQSRIFAIQRIGNCCDVWLDGPGIAFDQGPTTDAA